MPRIYLERREMGEELRRLLAALDIEADASAAPGECSPPADVVETADSVEIVMDLPGVPADHVHVLFSRGTILIAGIKKARSCGHSDATFHLAERTFGRFARAIRIAGAVNAGAARATLTSGELRVAVPRMAERRGREIRITVESA